MSSLSPSHEFLISQEQDLINTLVSHLYKEKDKNYVLILPDEIRKLMKDMVVQIIHVVPDEQNYNFVVTWIHQVVNKAANVFNDFNDQKRQLYPSYACAQILVESSLPHGQSHSSKSYSLFDLLDEKNILADFNKDEASVISEVLNDIIQTIPEQNRNDLIDNSLLDKHILEHLHRSGFTDLDKLESLAANEFVQFICADETLSLTYKPQACHSNILIKLIAHGFASRHDMSQNNRDNFMRWAELYWNLFGAVLNEAMLSSCDRPHQMKEVCIMIIMVLVQLIHGSFENGLNLNEFGKCQRAITDKNSSIASPATKSTSKLIAFLSVIIKDLHRCNLGNVLQRNQIENLFLRLCSLIWCTSSKLNKISNLCELEILPSHYMALVDPFASWFALFASLTTPSYIVTMIQDTILLDRIFVSFIISILFSRFEEDNELLCIEATNMLKEDFSSIIEADFLHSLFTLNSILVSCAGALFPFRRIGDLVRKFLNDEIAAKTNHDLVDLSVKLLDGSYYTSQEYSMSSRLELFTLTPIIFIALKSECKDLDSENAVFNCLVSIVRLMIFNCSSTTISCIFSFIIDVILSYNPTNVQHSCANILYKAIQELAFEKNQRYQLVAQNVLKIFTNKKQVRGIEDKTSEPNYHQGLAFLSLVYPLFKKFLDKTNCIEFNETVKYVYSLSNNGHSNRDKTIFEIATAIGSTFESTVELLRPL